MRKLIREIVRIPAALLFSLGIPVAIKEFILKPLRMRLPGDETAGQIFQWGGSLLLILGGYIFCVWLLEKRQASELSPRTALSSLAKGTLWGFLSIGFILTILGIAGAFRIEKLIMPTGQATMVLMLFLLVTTEEILYRAILYRIVETWFGTIRALIFSSVIFSLMHLANDYFDIFSFLAIVSGGALMGLMYTFSRNIWMPIAAHFSWNYSQILVGVPLSGSDEFSHLAFFRSRLEGHVLLTGGEFGPENSLVAIAYTTVSALILGYWLASRKSKRIIPVKRSHR